MFCCMLLYVHSSIAIILMGKGELVALLNLSSWCLVMVERLFLAVPWGCLRFVIVVFPDHTHYFSMRAEHFFTSTTTESRAIFGTSKMHLGPRLLRLLSVLRRWFCCCLLVVNCYSHCGILLLFYVLLYVTVCPF